jgi:hypothetical protein
MKLLTAVGVASMAGCATVDPARVQLVVEPTSQICGVSDRQVPIHIAVRNRSRAKLKIEVDSDLPPYVINGFSYEVLDEGGATDWKHGAGSHPPVPLQTLSMGPGDSTELVAPLYELTNAYYGKRFEIRFSDEDNHVFVTSSFKACDVK